MTFVHGSKKDFLKYRVTETLNLSTNADSITIAMKKEKKT